MSGDKNWSVEPGRLPNEEAFGRTRPASSAETSGFGAGGPALYTPIEPRAVFGRGPPGGGGRLLPKAPPHKASGPKPPGPGFKLPRFKFDPGKRPLVWIGGGGVLAVLLVCAIGAGIYLFHDIPKLPPTETLSLPDRAPAMIFEDPTGAVIATRGKKTGYRVTLKELPDYVPRAFLAAEDKRFYQHGALDLRGTIRAAFTDLRHRSTVQGGSTISQQIAKTLLLKPEKKFKRKAQEAVLAWELEHRLGKNGVLELYMNRIFFGQGAYGVDAAAQIYFGKPASGLTLQEAALLAALPQAPSRLSRNANLDAGLDRSHAILDTMGDEGWINLAQLTTAKANKPLLAPPPPGEGDIGYVLDYAAAEATRIAGAGAPDLIVTLTIDPRLQAHAQAILRQVIAGDGKAAHASQAALVAMTPDGAIRALVGGLDHTTSPFNRATQAKRQPGSSFKPFVYATALEQGIKTSDVFVDAPLHIGGWNPANYGGGYSGPVTVSEALARSINTVAVRVGIKVGPDKIGELARRFGLSTIPPHPDLAISLGAKEVTLLELVGGFQVFQNQGVKTQPYLIASIASSRGQAIYTRPAPQPGLNGVYDPVLAGKMVRMMMGVVNHGTGTRAAFGRDAAGKTGTSQDWRDAWFVGFTPDWAAGVWIGNDDYSPMEHVAGGTLPAAVWREFMVEAHKGMEPHRFDWLPGLDVGSGGTSSGQPQEPGLPPPPTVKADPRNSFYDDLANDFANASGQGD